MGRGVRVAGAAALAWLWLAGCPTAPDDDDWADDDDTGDDDTTGIDPVDESWGVVDGCDVPASPGFGDWYQAGSGILVHGDSAEDEALAAQVFEWYADSIPQFEIKGYAELTEDDRSENLFVIGSPETNPLLLEMNGALPVHFDEDGFFFGGYRWEGVANGIALIHPSPFADDAWVLLYVGNSVDGSYSTFTVWSGARDYEVVRSGWTLHLEGDLCRDGEMWGFYEPWADDYRAAWEDWVDGLEQTDTQNHRLFYPPGSEAADAITSISLTQENAYDSILEQLEVAALDHPIDTYLYPDNETKGEVTGNEGNAHAIPMNLEVHSVYGGGVYAIGAHEDVHVIAYHRIGDTNFALMGEGLAVMIDGVWWSEPLDYWASHFQDLGEIPPLTQLIDDFWGVDDTTTYPLAGHFVDFLRDGWGVDVLKTLYVAENLDAAFAAELGMTTAEVEAAWLATIE